MSTVIEHLFKLGEIAVIPTDTVYGVVARASDKAAVQRLYDVKHREHKPGTLVAASVEQLVELGVDRSYLLDVERFWPGAVSVIVPLPHLPHLHQGIGSLAIRIPDDERLLNILRQTGPLQTSSANQPGEPPATTIKEAKVYFKDTISWYEDGGYVHGDPSTIIKETDDGIEVIRQVAGKLI